MLVHGSFDRVRGNFTDQFEPVGDQFLYRLRAKGVPIRVSADERDRYIASFERFLNISKWVLIGGTFVFGLAIWIVQSQLGFSQAVGDEALWAVMAILVVGFLALYMRAYAAPSRELRDRFPEGGERSKEEFQRHNLGRLSYSQLIVPLLIIVGLWGLAIWRGEPLSGENLLWLGITAASIAIVLGVLYRKWRLETAEKH